MFEIFRLVLFSGILAALAVCDIRRGIIPNRIVYPSAIVVLCLNFFASDIESVLALGAGALLGGLLLLASLLPGVMGMGDVKLGFLMGLMTGLPNGIYALFAGIALGGLAAIFLLVSGLKTRKDTLVYGPYLAAGAAGILIAQYFSLIPDLFR